MRKFFILLVFSTLFLSYAEAFPQIPAYYEGHVFIDGKVVGEGVEIKVVTASGDEFTTTTYAKGSYQISLAMDDPVSQTDEGASLNEALTWYVDGKAVSSPNSAGDKAVSGSINSNFDLSAGGSVPDPTCADGIRNQGEAQVDCGGSCDPCPQAAETTLTSIVETTLASTAETTVTGQPTTTSKSLFDKVFSGEKDDDGGTESNVTSTLSTLGGLGSCADDIRNQGETGVDCGGPCPACGGGTPNWLIGIVIVVVLLLVCIVLLAVFFYLLRGKGLRKL